MLLPRSFQKAPGPQGSSSSMVALLGPVSRSPGHGTMPGSWCGSPKHFQTTFLHLATLLASPDEVTVPHKPSMKIWVQTPGLVCAPLQHQWPRAGRGLRGRTVLRGDVTSKSWPHTEVDSLQLLFFSFLFFTATGCHPCCFWQFPVGIITLCVP